MLQMMQSGMQHGLRRTLYAMAGCFSAVFLLLLGSILGVGALLAASPALFNILRYAGALYLIFLGARAWTKPSAAGIDASAQPDLAPASPKIIFRNAFLVGISNPKALLFAAAFFPQFIDRARP
jgi:threonine/homoserine/homoserine lactone efflux protein